MSAQPQDGRPVRGKFSEILKRAGPALSPETLAPIGLPPAQPMRPRIEEAHKIMGAVEEAAKMAASAEAEKSRKQFEHNQRRAGVLNLVSQARDHDGRKLFSPHDASVIWQVESLVHSIAGGSPTMLDPIFAAEPDTRRPINAAVDRAIRDDGPRHWIKPMSEELTDALLALGDNEREAVSAILMAKGLAITPENIEAARESLGPSEFDRQRLAASDVQPPADSAP